MSIIKLYTEDADPGVTLISNVFIDYYLKDANDAQLKVYLYLVRHISNHKPFDISNIADEFNHTETDVIRSLKYWEQKNVLSLEYDGNSICGIEFHKLDESMFAQKGALHMFPVPVKESEKAVSSEHEKQYSASELAEMAKEDPDWASVKAVVESYLNKPLTIKDLQVIAHIYKDLGFSVTDIDSLMDKCLSDGVTTMRGIKKVAEREYLSEKVTPQISAVMNALGNESAPTQNELTFINKWLSDMSLELVLEGCRKASLTTNSNRIQYANGIFKNWKERGIKSIEDMAKEEEAFRHNKEVIKKQSQSSKTTANKFKQFTQSNYDWDEINRELGIK